MGIYEYMLKYNLDIKEFAALCELSPSAIYAYLKSERTPRLDIAWAMIKRTNGEITIEELLRTSPLLCKPAKDLLDEYILELNTPTHGSEKTLLKSRANPHWKDAL